MSATLIIMLDSHLPEPDLLKILLEPLLEDFQYWFSQARARLEGNQLQGLDQEQQSELLGRVEQAQKDVSAAQSLFRVTNGQVGVDTPVVMQWHQLVSECWQVAMAARLNPSSEGEK